MKFGQAGQRALVLFSQLQLEGVHVSDAESPGLVYNPSPPNRRVASLIQWNNRLRGLTAISQCQLSRDWSLQDTLTLHVTALSTADRRGHHPITMLQSNIISIKKAKQLRRVDDTLVQATLIHFPGSLIWNFWLFLVQVDESGVIFFPGSLCTPQPGAHNHKLSDSCLCLLGPPPPKTALFEVLSPYLRVFGRL